MRGHTDALAHLFPRRRRRSGAGVAGGGPGLEMFRLLGVNVVLLAVAGSVVDSAARHSSVSHFKPLPPGALHPDSQSGNFWSKFADSPQLARKQNVRRTGPVYGGAPLASLRQTETPAHMPLLLDKGVDMHGSSGRKFEVPFPDLPAFPDLPEAVPFMDLGMPGQFGAPEASEGQRVGEVFADQQLPYARDPNVAPIASLGMEGWAASDAGSHSPQPINYQETTHYQDPGSWPSPQSINYEETPHYQDPGEWPSPQPINYQETTHYQDPGEWEQAPSIADMGANAPEEPDEAEEWESSSGTIWGENVDEYMTRLGAQEKGRSGKRPGRFRSSAPSSPAYPASPLSDATPSPPPSPGSAEPCSSGAAGFQLWNPADGPGRNTRNDEASGHSAQGRVKRRHPAQLSLEWVDRSKVHLRTQGGLPGEEGEGRDDVYAEDGGECDDGDEEEYDGKVLGNNWEGAGGEAIGRAPDASTVRAGFKMLTSGELGDGAWVLVPGKGAAAIDLSEEIRWWVTCTGRGLRLVGSLDARAGNAAGGGVRAALSRGRRRGEPRALITSEDVAGKGDDAVEGGSIVRFRRGGRSGSLEAVGRARVRGDSVEGGGRTRSRETSAGAAAARGAGAKAAVHESAVSRRAADKRGGEGAKAQQKGELELVAGGFKVGNLDEMQRMRLGALFREMRR